ncbi:MAG: PmeII family type II restriction endonuclease [Actinomycetes bacterium]
MLSWQIELKETSKSMAAKKSPLYDALRSKSVVFDRLELAELLKKVDRDRVERLSEALSAYVFTNVQESITKRNGLAGYRANPYVVMTSASVMQLNEIASFASFLFNSKLYAGLETSFGKSIESQVVGQYPAGAELAQQWATPKEKAVESDGLRGMSRQAKAQARRESIWREIDQACVVGDRRYMVSIKSGPSCINDTQVAAMHQAIVKRHRQWFNSSIKEYAGITSLDIVIGITYGTDVTTNNKENQILAKLLGDGFEEEDAKRFPGVLIDSETRQVRIRRFVGRDFWSFIGKPDAPTEAPHVFLEVLLSLALALSSDERQKTMESAVRTKLAELATAISRLTFPEASLPVWARGRLTENELVWLTSALSAFYDEGI